MLPLALLAGKRRSAPVRLRRTYAIPRAPGLSCVLPCRVCRKCAVTSFRSHFLRGRARRSAAWLVNQRFPHPRGFAARPIPCYAPPPPLAQKLRNSLDRTNLINEVGSFSASGSGSSPAQP